MSPPAIITCAVTGSSPSPAKHKAVPVTPAEIAQSAIEAASAGAAIAHIHVRDPVTAKPSQETRLFAEVMDRIRSSGVDLLINLTMGAGARFYHDPGDPKIPAPGTTLTGPDERIAHVLSLRPPICSLDVATMNRDGFSFINIPAHLEQMARSVRTAGVKPEMEVFDAGHLELAKHLVAEGAVDAPAFVQFCLGIKWGMPALPEAMDYLLGQLPERAVWSAFGIGPGAFPVIEASVSRGGHVRVGFEDNLYLPGKNLARSNAALVEATADIITRAGRNVATPDQARSILGLATA